MLSRKFLWHCMRRVTNQILLLSALNEGNKSGSVFNFIQQKLGGPSISDYEKLQAEKSDLQLKYDELLAHHRETCRRKDLPVHLKDLKAE
ncbi:hypothetical protein IHE45_15G053100 [Dioscorea alata]|uniref:Uncharacterized protein n=1 Tax=Dioscorea alata TaxID=55571 RepID=A0ACB7ULF6_DIOAL|nr:hypothetical protein IHE45_15G053100 [Dioscorea alata]